MDVKKGKIACVGEVIYGNRNTVNPIGISGVECPTVANILSLN